MDPFHGRRPTREEAIQEAGRVLAEILDDMDSRTPREVAERSAAVQCDGVPLKVIEDRVRAQRGLPPAE